LRGQVVARARIGAPDRLAARPQLGARTLGPRLGAEALEAPERAAELLARFDPPLGATQALAV